MRSRSHHPLPRPPMSAFATRTIKTYWIPNPDKAPLETLPIEPNAPDAQYIFAVYRNIFCRQYPTAITAVYAFSDAHLHVATINILSGAYTFGHCRSKHPCMFN